MLRSKFIIEKETSEYVYIIDIGVFHRSVTNDVVEVLLHLSENNSLGNRRLIYKDGIGRIDEIRHSNGEFTGFATGHVGIDI